MAMVDEDDVSTKNTTDDNRIIPSLPTISEIPHASKFGKKIDEAFIQQYEIQPQPPPAEVSELRAAVDTCKKDMIQMHLEVEKLCTKITNAQQQLWQDNCSVDALVNANKQGWLWKCPVTPSSKSFKRGWTRRWFVLKEFELSYYDVKNSSTPETDAERKTPKRIFDIPASDKVVVRIPYFSDMGMVYKKVRKFLPKGIKYDCDARFLNWFILFQVEEEKICLRGETLEESTSWRTILTKRIAQLPYVKSRRSAHVKPDEKVLKILENPEIEIWDFENCTDKEGMLTCLLNLLPKGKIIKTLSLAKCRLIDNDMAIVQGPFTRFCPTSSLERLDLRNNSIKSMSAFGLGAAISECNSLRELVLDHNELCDKGIEILAKQFWGGGRPIAAALQTCSLVHNNITDQGVQVFAEILSKAQAPIALKKLMLGENNIVDQGTAIMSICRAQPNVTVHFEEWPPTLLDNSLPGCPTGSVV